MHIWTSWGVLGCPRVSWGIKTDRNNDFNGDMTCVRGMKTPAAPLALVAVSPSFFNIFLARQRGAVMAFIPDHTTVHRQDGSPRE